MNDDDITSTEPVDGDSSRAYPASPSKRARAAVRRGGSKSILVAALSGISIALDWEQHKDESTIVVEAPNDQDWLNLDVGPLEHLDHRKDA